MVKKIAKIEKEEKETAEAESGSNSKAEEASVDSPGEGKSKENRGKDRYMSTQVDPGSTGSTLPLPPCGLG